MISQIYAISQPLTLGLFRRWIALSCTVLMLAGCASTRSSSDRQHGRLIAQHTQKSESFDGFYNVYQVHLTILKPEVRLALVDRLAEAQHWERQKLNFEREKAIQEMSSQSQVFMSFYSPRAEINDWTQPNSIWRVYMTHNGVRYEGRVQKAPFRKPDIPFLFPHTNRFTSDYLISFNLPSRSLAEGATAITITSSAGESEFQF